MQLANDLGLQMVLGLFVTMLPGFFLLFFGLFISMRSHDNENI